MATYSNNTTIKINTAVNTSATRTTNGSTTLYTVPANSYLHCSLITSGGLAAFDNAIVTIGGVTIVNAGGGSSPASFGLPGFNYFIGPGSAIILSTSFFSSGSIGLAIVGTLFTNTP